MKRARTTTAVFLATACAGASFGAGSALAGAHFSPKKCGQQEQKIVKKYSKQAGKKNLTPKQMLKIQKQEQKAINALIKKHGCVLRG